MSGSEPARGAQRGAGKAEWRAWLLAERAAVPPDLRRMEADALAAAGGVLAAGRSGSTVCCYVPFGTEPGSLDLVDTLADAGMRVLLPVIPRERAPLLWAVYGGPNALVEGPLRGLLEPTGERLPPSAIAEAALVLVPALAVDSGGVRLGRGAGYYDRTLPLTTAGTELMGVVRDAEFVPQLPADPHDVRLTAVLTPRGGPRRL